MLLRPTIGFIFTICLASSIRAEPGLPSVETPLATYAIEREGHLFRAVEPKIATGAINLPSHVKRLQNSVFRLYVLSELEEVSLAEEKSLDRVLNPLGLSLHNRAEDDFVGLEYKRIKKLRDRGARGNETVYTANAATAFTLENRSTLVSSRLPFRSAPVLKGPRFISDLLHGGSAQTPAFLTSLRPEIVLTVQGPRGAPLVVFDSRRPGDDYEMVMPGGVSAQNYLPPIYAEWPEDISDHLNDIVLLKLSREVGGVPLYFHPDRSATDLAKPRLYALSYPDYTGSRKMILNAPDSTGSGLTWATGLPADFVAEVVTSHCLGHCLEEGRVQDSVLGAYFVADLDLIRGSEGAPILTENGALAGVFIHHLPDLNMSTAQMRYFKDGAVALCEHYLRAVSAAAK